MLIKAHSVPRLASGLSPMQERLIRSGKHVRLVSAPTGSGKSYAFMHAVLDEGAHVLFIVPTKRLLQNLINDARDQAREQLQNRGWNEIRIQAWMGEQIIEWSGNQAKAAHESLSATRTGQVLNTGAHSSGRVIFAIPRSGRCNDLRASASKERAQSILSYTCANSIMSSSMNSIRSMIERSDWCACSR